MVTILAARGQISGSLRLNDPRSYRRPPPTTNRAIETMDRDDAEILDKEPLHTGFFQMNRYRIRHRLFAGGWSEPLSREIFERGPVAAVVPYDPVRDAVILIEQFRPGPLIAGHATPWVIEVVAGILEDGESPEELAYRETVEETGCTLQDVELVSSFFMAPGSSNEYCHLLCGKVDASGASGIHGNPDEGEDIRVFSEPVDAAYGRIGRGEIASAFSIIALQWLMLNRDEIRRRWT